MKWLLISRMASALGSTELVFSVAAAVHVPQETVMRFKRAELSHSLWMIGIHTEGDFRDLKTAQLGGGCTGTDCFSWGRDGGLRKA